MLIIRPDAPLFYANSQALRDSVTEMVRSSKDTVATLILDLDANDELDITSTEALAKLIEELARRDVRVALALVHATAADVIRRSASDGNPGPERIFPNLDSAVTWSVRARPVPSRERRRSDGAGHRRIAAAGGRDRAQPGPDHGDNPRAHQDRARVDGPVFVLGWLVGLGILLLLVAVRQFRSRPHGSDEPQVPKWMTTIDKTTPSGAHGLAAAVSGANPKNLLLAAGGAAAIAQTSISGRPSPTWCSRSSAPSAWASPVGSYFALGECSQELLARLEDWMTQHNAVIMTVSCLIIAAKLTGDGISGLTG